MTTGTYRTLLTEDFDSQQNDNLKVFLEDFSLLNQYSKLGFGDDSSPELNHFLFNVSAPEPIEGRP